jgi:hypothetical protein
MSAKRTAGKTVSMARDLVIACGGAAVGAALFALLAPSPEPVKTTTAAATPTAEVRRGRDRDVGCGHKHATPRGVEIVRPGGVPAVGPSSEIASSDESVKAAMALLDIVAASERNRREKGDDEEVADEAYAALEVALATDPRALAAAVDRFRTTRDQDELAMLTGLLGNVADPVVERAALEVATADPDAGRRVMAFTVLDALDLPAARTAALTALDRESDAAVRQAALHALPPPKGSSLAEGAEVVDRLLQVLRSDPVPETRRRAARELGDWSHTPQALDALAAAMRRDASPEVRAGAAFGLELARAASNPGVRAALVAAMEDSQEDTLVRENAWNALGAAGPLPPAEHAAWSSYRDLRDAVSK